MLCLKKYHKSANRNCVPKEVKLGAKVGKVKREESMVGRCNILIELQLDAKTGKA